MRYRLLAASVLVGLVSLINRSEARGDIARGAEAFRVCAACHSLAPDLNRTGPSLAGIWDRKAGSLPSFQRYSPALRQSGVTWDAAPLDAWLRGPAAFIPGNTMMFPGLAEQGEREDVIAFLKAVSMSERGGPAVSIPGAYTETPPDLKRLRPAQTVTAIRACGDSYFVRPRTTKPARSGTKISGSKRMPAHSGQSPVLRSSCPRACSATARR